MAAAAGGAAAAATTTQPALSEEELIFIQTAANGQERPRSYYQRVWADMVLSCGLIRRAGIARSMAPLWLGINEDKYSQMMKLSKVPYLQVR